MTTHNHHPQIASSLVEDGVPPDHREEDVSQSQFLSLDKH